jgi:hypothetical protein
MIKIPQKSSETVKDRQYNDQDTTVSFTVSDDFCGVLIIVLSVLYGFWWLLWYLDHCIVCSLRFLMTSVVSWSLYCLSFTISDDFCGILIIVLSVLYGFWWLLWYLDHCIVCPLRFLMTSVVSWSLYCLSFTVPDDFCGILILVLFVLCGFWWLLWYLDHCIVCSLLRYHGIHQKL